jgi:hypothetical protein
MSNFITYKDQFTIAGNRRDFSFVWKHIEGEEYM